MELISFIGLVAPHIVRMVVGNNHIYLIPGSILGGALLLLLSDLFAKNRDQPGDPAHWRYNFFSGRTVVSVSAV